MLSHFSSTSSPTKPANVSGAPVRKKGVPQRQLSLIMICLSGVLAAGVYGFLHYKSRVLPKVIVMGQLYIPASAIDYASANKKLFMILYHEELPMPLAVMEEYINVPVTPQTRDQGFLRDFVITPEKLTSMAPAHTLDSYLSNPQTSLYLKARIDRDGFGGPDDQGDVTSSRVAFTLNQTELRITASKKIGANADSSRPH